jgi:two-component system heavy metal sensor histidine kinase CusS
MPLTPEQRMRIFEKFYRIHNTASNVAGSGLGLAISKAIVLNHKGDIWVETGPNDVGNVFKFRLQRSPAPVKVHENKLTEQKARLLQI